MEKLLIENKKEAVLVGVKLSIALIFVASMMILSGTLGACWLFIQNSFNYPSMFVLIAYYLELISSIISGGRGIDQIRINGYKGDWKLAYDGPNYFNRQAIYLLISVIIYLIFVLFVII